ncbi:MAG: tetratricopeptide repeat protein [Erysipelotrichaceae bacterium]|nr:tetratricopeptide repeat protein [Erysipelotrichaceae bacterium]
MPPAKTIMDKKYLSIQFDLKVNQMDANAYQEFFANIMTKAISNFQRIRPYGNLGDGGNDGYRPEDGIYYQVYAPTKPAEKDKDAITKLKRDFDKAKNKWNLISKIKVFNFVYNDKNRGSSIVLEEGVALLNSENPQIEFHLFLTKDLDIEFRKLKPDDLVTLGFDLDSRAVHKVITAQLSHMSVELNRLNWKYVEHSISAYNEVVNQFGDEEIQLEFELLNTRTLSLKEQVEDSISLLEDIRKRYPSSIKPTLYLAEHYMHMGKLDECVKYLSLAKSIDEDNWHLKILLLAFDYHKGTRQDTPTLDFLDGYENHIKSSFYRWYSLIEDRKGNIANSDAFINRAIHFDSERLVNYQVKMAIIEMRIKRSSRDDDISVLVNEYYELNDTIRDKFAVTLQENPKFQVVVDFSNIQVGFSIGKIDELPRLMTECISSSFRCFLDDTISQIMVAILPDIELSDKDTEFLLDYISTNKTLTSNALLKSVLLQFLVRNDLQRVHGFFSQHKLEDMAELANSILEVNIDSVCSYCQGDIQFSVSLINCLKNYPQIRRNLIERLPENDVVNKDKLLLLVEFDEGNTVEAIETLNRIDINTLNFFEYVPILRVAKANKVWEYVVSIVEAFLKHELNDKQRFQLRLDLFTAYINLKHSGKVIEVGVDLLMNETDINLLFDKGLYEYVYSNTIQVLLHRNDCARALELLQSLSKWKQWTEVEMHLEAEVYISNDMPKDALQAIVSFIVHKNNITTEQFALCYHHLVVISNMLDLKIEPYPEINDNTFVKLTTSDDWYYIGSGSNLDATKITSSDDLYSAFISKKLGESIDFNTKYRTLRNNTIIEMILPTEYYIIVRYGYLFHKLTHERRWNVAQEIEISSSDNHVDIDNMLSWLKDNQSNSLKNLDNYKRHQMPLAFLAYGEGSLPSAISLISQEQSGFVNCASGTIDDFNNQKQVAKKILGGSKFFIDGTSALMLSESNILKDVIDYMHGMFVPVSVVNLLQQLSSKLRFTPGNSLSVHYSQGHIYSTERSDSERRSALKAIQDNIHLLESKPERLAMLSEISKSEALTEQNMLPELSDACILAQQDSSIVLSDDYLYLVANSIETGKPIPLYCSTYALILVLYEESIINHELFFGLFNYLTRYRFRFLHVSAHLLEESIFTKGPIHTYNIQGIRYLSLALTMSPEYGVSFNSMSSVVIAFIADLVLDDSIVPGNILEIVNMLFDELPSVYNNRPMKSMLIQTSCEGLLKNSLIILSKSTTEKANILLEIYLSKAIKLIDK